MQHYLTYKDEKSDKFWNIDITGNTFTVTYGKMGTPGQTQAKKFKDEAACLKEAQKLLNEKLKKGYLEKKGAKADRNKPSPKGKSEKRLQLDVPLSNAKTIVPGREKNEWWKCLVWILNEKNSSTQSREIYELSEDGVLSAPPSDEMLGQGTEVRFEGLTSLVGVPLDKMPNLDVLKVYPGEGEKKFLINFYLWMESNEHPVWLSWMWREIKTLRISVLCQNFPIWKFLKDRITRSRIYLRLFSAKI
ncbi:WGR domain-containing protein [Leptospira santarosai]|uniref:WGR domain protein n=1 Tax=Leptospira santarosai serovar Arenal str. MAVJ 401 TaxID=1049976 RepID=M6K1D9_9LEPT|nr:WGR domain protein [Leptospira santarosai serovar Arenal str. MAVJ 401]